MKKKYRTFRQLASGAYAYDLRLSKDGVIVNIINNKVVSMDGTAEGEKFDLLMDDLRKLGFK